MAEDGIDEVGDGHEARGADDCFTWENKITAEKSRRAPSRSKMARCPRQRLMSMREAVARFVPDGSAVCMGTALEAAIPFAAGHELIRQGRRNLTLIGPISDILFDQLVGAGCVARIVAAWVGNVSAGLGHNYRRACEQGVPAPLAVEDHSNLTLAVALLAGAIGAPYIPTRSLLGTGLLESNPRFRPAQDPWSGHPVILVPALTPDVAILHVQRADAQGHAHAWGTLGVTRDAALAARRVIVVAEEIRYRRRDPERSQPRPGAADESRRGRT